MDLIEKEGFNYKFNPSACQECQGACCRGESGYIWVKYPEIEAIADFLDMSIDDFAQNYLRKVKHRYSLIEKKIADDDYACIFFDETKSRCSIYPVRPNQCRTFPFWDYFKNREDELKNECPGIL